MKAILCLMLVLLLTGCTYLPFVGGDDAPEVIEPQPAETNHVYFLGGFEVCKDTFDKGGDYPFDCECSVCHKPYMQPDTEPEPK